MQQHGKSPRRRKLMLYFTYGLMTMAVAVISTVSILLALGYRFDLKSGDVEQGALLQFRSFPESASISLDGEMLPFNTPGKRTVEVGRHEVELRLNGYQTWKKSFALKPSELRWLNYARLVPEDLKTTAIHEFPAIAESLPSPDRKWIVVLPAADKAELTIVDVRDEKKPVVTPLVLPAGSFTERAGQPHAWKVVEWDFGARYILLKHTVGDLNEYIRVDRTDPVATVNVSSKLGLTLSDLHFSGSSGSVFYGLESGSLRRLDSGAGTISQPLVRDVAQFRIYRQDTLAYVKTPQEGKVGVGVVVGGKPWRVADYDPTVPITLDVSGYFNDYYLAVGRGTTVDIYKDPELSIRKKVASVSTASTSAWVRFSSSGRFVVAGTGSQFSTYDLETSEHYNVNLPGIASDPNKPLQWLDDYYLVSTAENTLRLTEFDGANQHEITSSLSGMPVSLNHNGKLLYSFTKNQTTGYSLQATQMTVEN